MAVRRRRSEAVSLLAAVSVVMAGSFGADLAGASPSEAATMRPAVSRTADRVNPEAKSMIQRQQSSLTGDIVFSVPSRTFQGSLKVSLGTSIAGAQIRYTTSGAPPTAASATYDGEPLLFTATTQLRVQAFAGFSAVGKMGTALYIARSINATHDLPLMVMDAYGAGKPGRDDYQDVAVMVMEPHAETAFLAQPPTLATRAGFHLRGQSSAAFEKAPYRLELWDNENQDADWPMLDLPADSDWALRGPFPDKTLIRDALAYSLGREMGLQTPRFAFVELYLNLDRQPVAEEDYQGVYLLVETIKRSSDRLDLQKLDESDLTMPAVSGGYILQFNALVAEPPLLECAPNPQRPQQPCWSDLEVIEPKDLMPQQQAWLTSYIQRLHDALHSADPANPQTGYPAYLDVESFVNRIIHNELARSGDAYVRSTHFYKDRGGKLYSGPLWDYDLAFDAFTGFDGTGDGTQGWQFQPAGGETSTTDWFLMLMEDPAFSSQVDARWRQLRQGVLSGQQLEARVAELTAPLANAAQRNFQRWPILGTAAVGGFQTQVTQTWEQQVQIMLGYLKQRAAWLDGSGWRPAQGALSHS